MARDDLSKTQAELDENRHQRDELTRQLALVPRQIESINAGPDAFGAGPPIATGDTSVPAGPSASTRVAELEQKLKTLRESYTDEHPDVIRTNRLLEQARQEAKDDEEKAARAATSTPAAVGARAVRTTAPNPVYDHLQIQLVSLETTIASLESRVKRNQAEVEKWQGLAKSVPEVAAEMAKLTRDYDVIKKAYDELLNRRESAKIGSDLETQTQTVQFRIIDPAEAPPVPVAPKRPLLLIVVLIGGILAGGAFVFLLAQADESISTVRELKDFTPLPVLGGGSRVDSGSQRRQRLVGAVSFAAVSLGLVLVCVIIISIESLAGLRA